MSDDVTSDTCNELPEVSQEDATPIDMFLEVVLDLLSKGEHPDAFATLTLTVGGLVVTGDAIPTSVWLRMWIDQLESGGVPFDAEARGLVDRFYAELVGLHDKLKEADKPAPAWRFVCMKDVMIFTGGGAPVRLPLWRGRLAEINGWSLGRLS